MIAALFNAARFFWSATYDHPKMSFTKVYGSLLLLQIACGLTLKWAASNRFTYTLWISLILFAEGGHFSLIPTVFKVMYGDMAT